MILLNTIILIPPIFLVYYFTTIAFIVKKTQGAIWAVTFCNINIWNMKLHHMATVSDLIYALKSPALFHAVSSLRLVNSNQTASVCQTDPADFHELWNSCNPWFGWFESSDSKGSACSCQCYMMAYFLSDGSELIASSCFGPFILIHVSQLFFHIS